MKPTTHGHCPLPGLARAPAFLRPAHTASSSAWRRAPLCGGSGEQNRLGQEPAMGKKRKKSGSHGAEVGPLLLLQK